MNRKKLSIILAMFFLVQTILLPCELSAETYPLNPQTKVNLNETNIHFKQIYDTIYLALLLYRLDAVKRYSKEAIVQKYGHLFDNLSDVRFDLEHIDGIKKGWTRYYPFSIGDRNFIIRIFLTEELAYQTKMEVLFEGTIENPAVTFQILAGLNSILEDCKIRPYSFHSVSQVDTSP